MNLHSSAALNQGALQPNAASVTGLAVPGGWSERRVLVAEREFIVVSPTQPDSFLEALAELPVEQHDDHDVYWAQLWQAAPPTAARILRTTWPLGMEALEFGCGVGLAGLAGLAAGLQVTFSDYVETAVRTAVENAQRNGFDHACGAILDWRHPPQRQWPFVFACDVLYNQQMHEPLIDFLAAVLAPNGLCWIGDAGRFHAGKFLRLAGDRGFATQIEDEAGQALSQPHHGKFQLFSLKRA